MQPVLQKAIHASLVTDDAGKYNIKITIAGSANPPAGATGNLTASPSGIQVSYSNSVLSTVNTTGTLNGTATTTAYSTVNLFAVDLGSSVSGTSDLVGSSAAAPLVTGADLVLSFPASGGDAAFSITLANGTTKTVNELVAAINADTTAVSKGITAAFVDAGLSTANIELRIADKKRNRRCFSFNADLRTRQLVCVRLRLRQQQLLPMFHHQPTQKQPIVYSIASLRLL